MHNVVKELFPFLNCPKITTPIHNTSRTSSKFYVFKSVRVTWTISLSPYKQEDIIKFIFLICTTGMRKDFACSTMLYRECSRRPQCLRNCRASSGDEREPRPIPYRPT